MSKQPSLSKLTAFYTVGNILSQSIRFILFFGCTFLLSKEDLGFYDLANTSISLLTPILTLQISEGIMRWCIDNKEESHLKKVVTGSLLILLVNTIFLSFLYFIVSQYVHFQSGLLLYCITFLQAIFIMLIQFARGLGKNFIYILGNILSTLFFALFVVLTVLVWRLDIQSLLIANIVALLCTIVILSYKLNSLKYINLNYFDASLSKKMLGYSAALIPNSLSWWAISAIDKYIILAYLGMGSNGIFAVAFKFASILLVLINIFNTAWLEKAITSYKSENRNAYYSAVLDKYAGLLFSSLIVLVAISKPLLKYVTLPSYYEAWKLLPFMYLAIAFQALAIFLGTGYISSKDTKGAFLTTFLATVINILLNFLLIPSIGLVGSSISLLLSFFILFIARMIQTRKYFSITLPIKKILLLTGFFIVSALLNFSESPFIWSFNTLFAICVFLIINKKLIHHYWIKIKKLIKDPGLIISKINN